MSSGDTRLTRAAGTTSDDRTEVTTARSRTLVGAAIGLTRVWRATRDTAQAAARAVVRTVRPAGVFVLAAATFGLIGGIAFGWVEWIVAAAAALALLVLSVPFLAGSRSYGVDLTLSHERIVAGSEVDGAVVVRNIGRRSALPGRIDVPVGAGIVEFPIPLLRPGQDVARTVEIPPQPRGVLRVGPAITVRSDPLGLLSREHAFEDVHDLYVHPRTVALPSTSSGLVHDLDGNPTRRLVDADMSFHAIREYVPGDARRQIHWKSTAKTGRPMVRQYEESRRSRMAIVFPLREGDFASPDEFELAVSCAASLSLRALRDARDLDIVVGAEIPRVVRGRLRAIRRLSSRGPRQLLDGFSGVQRLTNTMSIADVCRLTAEAGERLSIAVVVAGSRVGLAALRHAALAFSVGTSVLAVVCDERAHPRSQQLGNLTVVTVGVLDDLAGLLARGATG
ncbi:DUF58 domain-containing protein [Microbacterium sp.]|uniref:DUF58 domain-containing protein n=1 Tax=Microbacterium sp. TaxID=51671 RepID=UPI003A84501A